MGVDEGKRFWGAEVVVKRYDNLCCGNHLPKTTITIFFTHLGHHFTANPATRCFAVRDFLHAAESPFSTKASVNTSRLGFFVFEV
jgi:hypothetical protein